MAIEQTDLAERDRELLRMAGLSVSEAAKLLSKSRQAVNFGVGQPKTYFNAPEVSAILHDAKRRDHERLVELQAYIVENFAPDDGALISFSGISRDQIRLASAAGNEFIFVFNGTVDRLSPSSLFGSILLDVVSRGALYSILIPGEWVVEHLQEMLGIDAASHVQIFSDASYLPSLLVMSTTTGYQGFCFGVVSSEELQQSEAVNLWNRLKLLRHPIHQRSQAQRSA